LAIDQNRVLIIIPTLDEIDTIQDLISDITFNLPQINILVVDDGSQDGTYESLKEISIKNENLCVINRYKRLGLGSAYRHGFIYAKGHQYTHVIQMDGDGSHRVDDLKKLLIANDNYDLVVGSRYVSGGNILGWKFSRKFISQAGNIFAKYALRLDIKDATSGFKRLSRSIFADSELLASKTSGYGFQVEIIHFCKLRRLSMVEIPITFIDRRFGYSKFNKFIVLEAFVNIIKWIIKR
jgi:dolichol-phosphate mannosyltransferase